MWLFYLLAVIPVFIGGWLWMKSREVIWWEWLAGSAIAFILAGIFHWQAIRGMTTDVETWSGVATTATHHPRWIEQTEHTSTDSKGNTHTYYTYTTHAEAWTIATSISDEGLAASARARPGEQPGVAVHDVGESEYHWFVNKFGKAIATEQPYKTDFYSGDRNVYVCKNRTGWFEPVTAKKEWQNRVKAAPSVFSFAKVPPGIKVYSWPENPDWRRSSRLMGTAANTVDLRKFDEMNSRLGPVKKVNVILIGFGGNPQANAEWQRAAWTGGKKNDLVLCYGGGTGKVPEWATVFGWSDSDVCKKNLESILMEGPLDDTIIPKIEAEISAGYKIKDWSQFDYIAIEPPAWAYFVFLLVQVLTQGGFYLWAHANDYDKENT